MMLRLTVPLMAVQRAARHVTSRLKPAISAEESEALARKVWRQLRRGTYRPSAPRHRSTDVGSKRRALEIPSVEDRVVGRLLLERLRPSVDRALPSSVICRPGIDHREAIAGTAALRAQLPWAVRADLANAFPSTPVDGALRALERVCRSRQALDGVRAMMAVARPRGGGLPTGHPLSPLLLDVYLADVDRRLERQVRRGGGRIWRYVDDLLVLTAFERDAHRVLGRLRGQLGRLGLELHAKKTRICKPDEPVPWLGFEIDSDGTLSPSDRAIAKLFAKVQDLDPDAATRHTRGWIAYFGDAGRQALSHARHHGDAHVRPTTHHPTTSTRPTPAGCVPHPDPTPILITIKDEHPRAGSTQPRGRASTEIRRRPSSGRAGP